MRWALRHPTWVLCLSILCLSILWLSCTTEVEDVVPEVAAQVDESVATYADLKTPTDIPELLFPQLLAVGQIEHSAVFSPDLKTVFATISDDQFASFVVMQMTRRDGRWSALRPAPFSGTYSDHGTMFSPSGERLFVASTRPLPERSEEGTWHLWQMSARGEEWSEPRWMQIPGIEERWQSHASMSDDGRLYFHVLSPEASEDQAMNFDIYRSTEDGEGFSTPEKLGPGINTDGVEVTAWVAKDESFLLFAAYDRPDGHGRGDLYVSFKNSRGEWTAARNLGPGINTAAEESNPTLTPDGRYLIFSSTRQLPAVEGASTPKGSISSGLHLYWVRSSVILGLKSRDRPLS